LTTFRLDAFESQINAAVARFASPKGPQPPQYLNPPGRNPQNTPQEPTHLQLREQGTTSNPSFSAFPCQPEQPDVHQEVQMLRAAVVRLQGELPPGGAWRVQGEVAAERLVVVEAIVGALAERLGDVETRGCVEMQEVIGEVDDCGACCAQTG